MINDKRVKWAILQRPLMFALTVLCLCGFAYSGDSQVELKIKTNHYYISGNTYKEMNNSIIANRPWGTNLNFFAFTKWMVEWHVRTEFENGFCKVGSVKIAVKADITMPAYKPPTNRISLDFLERWGTFYRNLLEHELGHVRIAKMAGDEVYSSIIKLQPQRSHYELLILADQTAKKIIDKYRDKEIEYDRTTQHGLNQIRNK